MIHNPKHPGKMIKSLCLSPLGISVTDAAKALDISRPTLSKLINGKMSITPEMAIRLDVVFHTSAKLWLNMQAGYDLWKAEKQKKKLHLKPLNFKEFGLTSVFAA